MTARASMRAMGPYTHAPSLTAGGKCYIRLNIGMPTESAAAAFPRVVGDLLTYDQQIWVASRGAGRTEGVTMHWAKSSRDSGD